MNRAGIVACAVFAGCFHPTGVDPSLLSSSSDPSSSGDMLSSGGSEVGTGDASEASTTTGGSVSSTGGAASSTSSNTANSTATTGGGCGDGNVEDGEECDDANGVAGDGCDHCVKEFRRVFVTSKVFTGNLGGLAGADKKCQDAADAAELPGMYKAWLSVAGESPAESFVHSPVPYRQVDGVEIAKDWEDLTDGQLAAPLVVSEFNGPAGTGIHSCAPVVITVWTGTGVSGSAIAGNYFCDGWNGTGEGFSGSAESTDSDWTQACIAKCADQAALYCVEQ